MTDDVAGPPEARKAMKTTDGAARFVTALLSFLIAIALVGGPIIWGAAKLNGDEVSVDGGALRLVTQVVLAAVFGWIASRRSRNLPIMGIR